MFLVVLMIIGLSLLPTILCTNSVALHYTVCWYSELEMCASIASIG